MSTKTVEKKGKTGDGSGMPDRRLVALQPKQVGATLPPKVQKDLDAGTGGLDAITVSFYPQGITEYFYQVNGETLTAQQWAQAKGSAREMARQQQELHAAKGALNKVRTRLLLQFPNPETSEEARGILAIDGLKEVADGIMMWSQKRFDTSFKDKRDALVGFLRPHADHLTMILRAITASDTASWNAMTEAERALAKANSAKKAEAVADPKGSRMPPPVPSERPKRDAKKEPNAGETAQEQQADATASPAQ